MGFISRLARYAAVSATGAVALLDWLGRASMLRDLAEWWPTVQRLVEWLMLLPAGIVPGALVAVVMWCAASDWLQKRQMRRELEDIAIRGAGF
jgi:hypothetical protein